MPTSRISGTAVAGATAGAILIYSGLRGMTPLQALRDVLSGHPAAVPQGRSASAIAADIAASPGLTHTASSGNLVGPNGAIAEDALTRVGSKYVWGAAGPDAFDCSGLVKWAFAQIGENGCPHNDHAILLWSKVNRILTKDVAAGDLAIWPGHIVIMTGPGAFVGAQNTRVGVITGAIGSAHAPVPGYPIYVRYYPNGGSHG